MNKILLLFIVLVVASCSTPAVIETIPDQPAEEVEGWAFVYTPEYEYVETKPLDFGFSPGEGWGYKTDNETGKYTHPEPTVSGTLHTASKDEIHSSEPLEPITIGFVKKDIHTVMHFIALRTGLKIIVDGEVELNTTIRYLQIDPIKAIREICRANNLLAIQDGDTIILKKRHPSADCHYIGEDRYEVDFRDCLLIDAILETAKITNTAVYIAARPQYVEPMFVELHLGFLTVDQIFKKLAELGGLKIRRSSDLGYEFTYK